MNLFRISLGIVFVSLCAFLGAGYALITSHRIDFSILERYNAGKPSIVLDDEGNEWARFQLDRKEPVELEHMSPHIINAFLAAEDWQFFNHNGISYKGMVRSLLVNLYHGRTMQGASTITQQLVRLLFLDARKTLGRKLKEQLYAVLVEQQFTKHQILQLYLNNVYFGCGIYGVQAACQRFWATDVSAVTVEQAATLAGIMRSPAQYCPLLCPLSCQNRRNVILFSMHKLGFISAVEYDRTRATSLYIVQAESTYGSHVKEMIRQQVEDIYGKQAVYTGGLIIQSTLNRHMQEVAQTEFVAHCTRLRKEFTKDLDGALMSIEGKTGEIKALVGGVDFITSSFNRAIQARRQAGSIFKPLVYAAAIQQGATLADTQIDEPIQIEQDGKIWQPHNYNHQFNGTMTLAYALAHSNNIVPVKLVLQVGGPAVAALAKACGITSPVHAYPSLALGCVDITLKEAVGMFNVFAHNGNYAQPHVIRWIKDQGGKKIYRQSKIKDQAIQAHVADQVAKGLELGLKRIQKNYSQRWLDCQAISKTGTTNESRTCWFVGATPSYTTAVYIGCDDNRSMGNNIFPVRNAFPIWLSFNRAISSSVKEFTYDSCLSKVLVDERTGEYRSLQELGVIEIMMNKNSLLV
jgi:penicillin-binding protein 1A